ncbi:hypothetical protein [Chryseobacterium sp.]|uniref:hypothetical protein n=1 Tax=Chryseobacterium sp. TaxID=1871047 RepID=UPI0011CAD2BA|nr:hypothetical protein [Chryseobacterium sp.]TXF75904.1 hypothetical protein FUA25_08340 [Chryseobacterium sp.]
MKSTKMDRKEIFERIIEEQKKIINSLQESVNRYKSASDLDEDDTSDPDDYARQTEAKDMQLRFEKMLSEATKNLNFLDSEKEMSHTEIENGSLVETDKNYLYIGISVPAFKVQDKEVISFSEDAPVFKEIKGKKAGDQVKIGENSFKIINIQ